MTKRQTGGANKAPKKKRPAAAAVTPMKASAKERPPITDEQIARFMTRGRSVAEVAKEFKMTPEEAGTRLEKGFDGYELFPGPKNLAKEDTYVCVPHAGSFKRPGRAWKWEREKNGQPYGVVAFPADFNHQKIRIIPIDGILYGDPAHDAERFDAIIKKIAREPNTFCFLNGDIIAEIKGGKREVREQILLERSVQFQKKMQAIAHKILWAQQGCIEARSLNFQGFDPLEHFCAKLDIPYFLEPVYIDLFWGTKLFTVWSMHGHSTAQVKGAKMNALRRPAQMHEYTHFICMGHVGDAIWNRVPKIHRDTVAGRLDALEEFHVILGNFKKYLGTRAARRGETPPSNETVVLYVYPDGNHHVKTEHGGKS
ncbi:MAG TPA: hypothetical protein VL500_03370 [Candidatus Eisenbacteria bacterium]|nr:hypothetical protein [Candidatus Eisenbacteria bacterium]